MPSPAGSRPLLLLDAASLYVRAFHGVPRSITDPAGRPVNAVRGFLDMVAHLVATRRPDRLVACWDDDWRPAFRVAAWPGYKAHRLADPATGAEDFPAELTAQVPLIVEVLAAFGIARVGCPGFEADDVIGTLAERAAVAGAGPVEIATGDRDLFQLVDDARRVRVLYVGRGVRRLEVIDQGALSTRYGVPTGSAYADLAVLRGDPSDGLPGVAGVGEKTAAGLLAGFGTLDDVLAAARDADPGLSPGVARRIREAAGYLATAPAVVRVVRDVPVAHVDDRLPVVPPDPDRLLGLAVERGLSGSTARLLDAMTTAQPTDE